MALNDTYIGYPSTSIDWPTATVGLPQIAGYTSRAPQVYGQAEVLDGPAYRRVMGAANMHVWNIALICTPAQARAFEDFYVDTILQGMLWFNMPLSLGRGLTTCVVREIKDSAYSMRRLGPNFQYAWRVEGYAP